jgi:hypothetical protein
MRSSERLELLDLDVPRLRDESLESPRDFFFFFFFLELELLRPSPERRFWRNRSNFIAASASCSSWIPLAGTAPNPGASAPTAPPATASGAAT